MNHSCAWRDPLRIIRILLNLQKKVVLLIQSRFVLARVELINFSTFEIQNPNSEAFINKTNKTSYWVFFSVNIASRVNK